MGTEGTYAWTEIEQYKSGWKPRPKGREDDTEENIIKVGGDSKIEEEDEDHVMTDKDIEIIGATTSNLPISYSNVPDNLNSKELQYMTILNKLLPKDIRVLAWSPVNPTFDARFDCTHRTYRYFFPNEKLDLKAMQEAASRYNGVNDFRYFCKIDPSKRITNYQRRILSSRVSKLSDTIGSNSSNQTNEDEDLPASSFLVFEVSGHAFLWHQVRCMMAVLLLVGRGLESPSVMDSLLSPDNGEVKGRPIYSMASEIPLVLVECGYEEGVLKWQLPCCDSSESGSPLSTDSFLMMVRGLWGIWRELSIKATQVRQLMAAFGMDHGIENEDAEGDICETLFGPAKNAIWADASGESGGYGGFTGKAKDKKYIPLLERPRCDSAEERLRKHDLSQTAKKKRKIENE